MHTIILPADYYSCPIEWKNFINNMYDEMYQLRGVQHMNHASPDMNKINKEIVKRLNIFGCDYNTETDTMVFNDVQDYLFFKLKWS